MMGGSDISWTICKLFGPHSKHVIAQFFTGRMLFLTLNKQCQNTEGKC